jgi:hypothetical protein
MVEAMLTSISRPARTRPRARTIRRRENKGASGGEWGVVSRDYAQFQQSHGGVNHGQMKVGGTRWNTPLQHSGTETD